jgi:epoxyqueuosine reductase
MTTSTSEPTKAWIRTRAAKLGFDVCGITGVEQPWPAAGRLEEFVALGRHGEMDWMATSAARRRHPRAMWRQAKSAIVLGLNYGPTVDPLAALARRDRGAISVYAQGADYHALIKGRLKTLAGQIKARTRAEVKVFVDTAPLMEKPLAEAAGLGWQGKHTNLVSRAFGSWLFLGVVLTDLALAPDASEEDHCGECRACLDICPTNAFPAPYQLDARRCISYLTIEHQGAVAEDLRPLLGNRIYGCDDCLAVCPWNKFAQAGREAKLAAREAMASPPLATLASLDDAAFRARFGKSPIKRIGRDRFVRNVLYAIGNSADAGLAEAARARLDDPSPVVRDAAAWALGRLQPGSLSASNRRAIKAAPRSI